MTGFWTSERIERALGTPVDAGLTASGIATDTRALEPGAVFVALAGERFDAHDFLPEAATRGARAAVVRRGTPATAGLPYIEVDDTLVALGQLATERRRAVNGPVVAVTGTNGKTSIKELLAAALATRWSVHATRENLNNLVGVPLTLLSAPDGCEALVVEAGSNAPGEIARLRDIIRPAVAVVSNVSAGHLAGFRDIVGVLHEKSSLLHGAQLAVVGMEPPALAERAREVAERVIVAGLADPADRRPEVWGLDDDGHGWCVVDGTRMELPIVGQHQLENLMIAVAVAVELGLELRPIADRLRALTLPSGRCEVIRRGELVILQDAYNANPGSVSALLSTAQSMRSGRPLVVMLGTMLELGSDSVRLHEEVADQVLGMGPQLVAVLGEFVPAFRRRADELGSALITADDAASLGRALGARLSGREFVLVKGSRGVHLERAIPHLLSSDGTPCSTTC